MPRPFNPNNYRGWRILVLKRDGEKCVICGSSERIECDHIKSVRNYPELIFDVNNGRVLCHKCHVKTDSYGAKSIKGIRRRSELHG